MCKKCDDLEIATYYNREPEPCQNDEHKFRPEELETAPGQIPPEDFICLNCGWSLADIEAHDAEMLLLSTV